MARPEKPIDWDLVDRFLEAGCNQKQICSAIGVSEDTLQRRFKEKYDVNYTAYAVEKAQYGESLLLAAQMKKALSGNTQMQIWLGKVRLGQREPPPLTNVPPNDSSLSQILESLQIFNTTKKQENAT